MVIVDDRIPGLRRHPSHAHRLEGAEVSTQFPDRFPDDVTIGPDLDLDAEEFYLPSGERLTEQRAQELVEKIAGPVPGRPSLTAPGTHSPMLHVRVPAELKDQLTEYAERESRRQSDIVRDALAEYLAVHCEA
jgi:hypothetical protein